MMYGKKILTALAAVTAGGFLAASATADVYTWDAGGSDSNWSTDENWNPDASVTTVAGDTVNLDQVNLTATGTSTADGGATLGILNIGDTDGTNTWTLGGGPLTFDNNSSNAQINQTVNSKGDTINAGVSVGGNGVLEINNSAANQLTLHGAVTGGSTLLLNGTGTGVVRFENLTGATFSQITQNSDTSQVTVATGSFTFTGGVTITRNGNAQFTFEQGITGTGDVTMVENSSTLNSLRLGGVDTTGSIYHQGTGSRTDEINGNISASVVSIIQEAEDSQLDVRGGTQYMNGTRYLINNSSLSTGNGVLNLKQSTDGTGTLVLQNNSPKNNGVYTAEGTLAHNGDVISNGTGSGSTTIRSNIGSSITAITQASSTSQLNIYDANAGTVFTVNPAGTSLINTGGARIDVKQNMNGTGDLILQNDTSVNDVIYLKEKTFNPAGQIINSGTGAGRVILSSNSKLGPDVTAIVQNSATSMLRVESALSGGFVGDTIVQAGILSINRLDLLADTSTVMLYTGGTLNLDYSGIDTVDLLYIDGVAQAPGVYNSGNTSFITGNGALNVLHTVIPEPATLALLGLGGLATLGRKRRHA